MIFRLYILFAKLHYCFKFSWKSYIAPCSFKDKADLVINTILIFHWRTRVINPTVIKCGLFSPTLPPTGCCFGPVYFTSRCVVACVRPDAGPGRRRACHLEETPPSRQCVLSPFPAQWSPGSSLDLLCKSISFLSFLNGGGLRRQHGASAGCSGAFQRFVKRAPYHVCVLDLYEPPQSVCRNGHAIGNGLYFFFFFY